MCARESQQARYTWWFGLLDGCCSYPPPGRPQIIGLGGARRQAEMTDQGTADSQRSADGVVRNPPPTIVLSHFTYTPTYSLASYRQAITSAPPSGGASGEPVAKAGACTQSRRVQVAGEAGAESAGPPPHCALEPPRHTGG